MPIGPIPDAIVAAIVSAGLTGSLAYYVSYRSDKRSAAAKRQSFRKSLIAEIESMEIERLDHFVPTKAHNRFPTVVYESNSENLGTYPKRNGRRLFGFIARF